MNYAELSPEQLVEQAFLAAKQAEADFRAKYGEPMYCGFAWAVIRPANCKVAKILKAKYGARKGYYGGLEVSNPGSSFTQSMDIKECGTQAFVNVLKAGGVRATMASRAD